MSLILNTEEEVRTKFFYEWLKDKGVEKDQMLFERQIKLQLGRETIKAPKKSGRIDILIRSKATKQNLIICELKAKDKQLNESALNQAVSYARAIQGNMAPIVILSNYLETKVYCSLTKKEIPNITSESLVSGEFLTSDEDFDKLREQAIFEIAQQPYYLSTLLSKISSNEMSVLRGDIGESRKYCKDLYYPLSPSIDYQKQIVLISGEPQSGKTNYICNEFLEYDSKENVCVFLRSKSIVGGVKLAIKNRLIGLTDAPEDRVNTLIKTAFNSQKLTIFIDALNEIPVLKRKVIIEELGIYVNLGCSIIITCTESFVKTLKMDSEGTQTEIFRMRNSDIFEIIKIPNLSENYHNVISLYKERYNVDDEPKHKLSSINSIGKYYQIKKSAPEKVISNEYDIHKIHLNSKIEFITEVLERNVKQGIEKLAELLAFRDGPLKESEFCLEFLSDRYALVPEIFITSGILEKNGDHIDFYEESYRDIALIEKAIFVNKSPSGVISWLSKFENHEISTSCITKYLCFYDVSYKTIESLDNETKSTILSSVISYVSTNGDLTLRPLNLILNIINDSISTNFMTPEVAFEHIERFNELIGINDNAHYDKVIVARIIGFCCSHLPIEYISDIITIEGLLSEDDIEGEHNDQYISLAKIAVPYLLYNDNLFTYSFLENIKEFKQDYNNKFLVELTNLYSSIVERTFNYYSHMCDHGSYVDIVVDSFKESKDPGELKEAYDLLKELKSLLQSSQPIDSTLEYLEEYLADLPTWVNQKNH